MHHEILAFKKSTAEDDLVEAVSLRPNMYSSCTLVPSEEAMMLTNQSLVVAS